jgi:hypothetical protein
MALRPQVAKNPLDEDARDRCDRHGLGCTQRRGPPTPSRWHLSWPGIDHCRPATSLGVRLGTLAAARAPASGGTPEDGEESGARNRAAITDGSCLCAAVKLGPAPWAHLG